MAFCVTTTLAPFATAQPAQICPNVAPRTGENLTDRLDRTESDIKPLMVDEGMPVTPSANRASPSLLSLLTRLRSKSRNASDIWSGLAQPACMLAQGTPAETLGEYETHKRMRSKNFSNAMRLVAIAKVDVSQCRSPT